MAVNSQMELFLGALADILDDEYRLIPILQTLAAEAQNPQVKQTYEQHLDETEHQIQNVNEVFRILGEQPRRLTCLVIEALAQAHDQFKQRGPSAAILQAFDLDAAEKTEHYEIASYTMLIEMCHLMNQPECARLLEQNLAQERDMADRVLRLSQATGQQLIGQAGQMFTQGQPGERPLAQP
jgi:ferritin-like metal-binding protein YciE